VSSGFQIKAEVEKWGKWVQVRLLGVIKLGSIAVAEQNATLLEWSNCTTNKIMSANIKRQGMALTSLVLGIMSVLCLGPFAGIPAIILGHTAHRRTRNAPDQYAGRGLAIAGFIMGYASILLTALVVLIFAARVLPQMAPARSQAQRIKCFNNMKNIGLAFRIWATDHQDQFPFNVSTNQSEMLETSGGIAKDTVKIFQTLSNELGTPTILVCPADTSKRPARSFADLQGANISYEVETGPEVKETNPQEVLARCPIHGTELLCDGSVH
jgi:hypothetical protein